ncbi:hypothetical protein PGT21_027805 [Puccinia graminis f. sp. tritici]|uniref:Uncharacterized protein n=1 Tax=Puccinia graminis f. sp. tritici TaxID=56615 RepID=A0A5B0NXC7_PUCGR|nr:hypothetical protein PGT21_027805 [Puccinia graminis f. sp. tritici]KAA1135066.1 hypothetical protein PGTUg99_021854 [Puccinia graminis f. sp. tritici]
MNDSSMLLEELKDIANHNQCKNGKHNPLVAHPEDKCWALNPHQQLIANQKGASSNNTVATSSNAVGGPGLRSIPSHAQRSILLHQNLSMQHPN